MIAQHSSVSQLWYSPVDFVNAAREVLGPIDLDPASDAFGNDIIQAKRFITKEDDGATAQWVQAGEGPVSIWMNPPGVIPRRKPNPFLPENRPLPKLFWNRLLALREAGDLRHAIVAVFSLEQLRMSQKWSAPMLHFPLCLPVSRVKWNPPSGFRARNPTQSAAFVYVPGTENKTEEFRAAFRRFGFVSP